MSLKIEKFIVLNSVADPDAGSRIPTTSQIQYIQDFTFKHGEKQEKLNFIRNMTSIMTFSCMKKIS
jgi:hypothetical protein